MSVTGLVFSFGMSQSSQSLRRWEIGYERDKMMREIAKLNERERMLDEEIMTQSRAVYDQAISEGEVVPRCIRCDGRQWDGFCKCSVTGERESDDECGNKNKN